MALVGDISVKLGLNATDFHGGLKEAEKNMKNVGKSVTSVGKSMFKSVSVPLIALGGTAIKIGADFEQSMAKVKGVTGASGQEFEQLTEKARELGRSTRFSANEVADGMGFLGMAGFTTAEILDSVGDVLNLASISGMDLAQTADIASNMLTGMGLDADEMGRIVDVMAKTMTDSNTDVMGLGEAFKYVAPIASGMGIDLEELSASIGLLGDAGLQGGQAGRLLANGLMNLASPTDSAQKLMDELGISAFDANGELRSLPEVIGQLEKGFKDLSPKERSAAMTELFGQGNAKAWSALIAEGADSLEEFSNELRDAEGAGQDLADTIDDTLWGDLASLKSMLSDIGIEIYNMLEEPLRKVVQTITDVAGKFFELDESTRMVALVLGVLGAVIPPIIITIGIVIQTVAWLAGAFSKLAPIITRIVSIFKKVWDVIKLVRYVFMALSGPVGLIIAILAGLIAVGIAVWKNWDTIKEMALNIWGHIADFMGEVWEWIKETAISIWTSISDFFVDLWTSISDYVLGIIWDLAEWMAETWISIRDGTIEIFNTIIDFFVEWGLWLYDALNIQAVVDMVIGIWEFLRDTISITTEMLVAIVTVLWNKMVDKVVEYATNIWKFVSKIFTSLYNSVKNIITRISNTFSKIWNKIYTFASNIATKIWNKIKSIFTKLMNTVKSIITSIYNTFQNIWNNIYSFASGIVTKIFNIISNIWNSIWTTTTNIFNNVKNSIITAFNTVKSTVSNIVNSIFRTIKRVFGKVTNAMLKPVTKAQKSIKKALDKIKNFFSNLKLKIPKPKLPKISVSKSEKSFMGATIPVPKFSVSWNAKGNIFTGASLLGGGQGVGEAGAEVVMPIQRKRYMKPYASMVADLLAEKDSNDKQGVINNFFEIAQLVVREEADIEKIAKELDRIQKGQQRAKGDFVY